MSFFLMLIGIGLFGIGLIVCLSPDVPGRAAKLLIPALGVSCFVFGVYLTLTEPPVPKPTAVEMYQNVFDSCMRTVENDITTEIRKKQQLTKQEMCAKRAKAYSDAMPKEENKNEKVLLPVPAEKSNP